MDLKNFASAIAQITEEKGISTEKVIESIETAVAAAYKKEYGKKGQIIKAKLNPAKGDIKFWQIKLVVSEDMIYSEEEIEEMKKKAGDSEEMIRRQRESEELEKGDKKVYFNPEKHITVEDAKKMKSGIKAGEELEIVLTPHKDYGRIAAQTAKQVILQKIREAERDAVLAEFKTKEGEIVSGVVQRIEGRNIFVDVGKTLGILPKEEQVYGEFYRPGQRLKVYVLKVEETSRGPVVLLSRAYPKLITKLFELEVPEITQGTVVIRAIAREAGARSKIAVESKAEGIDAIGSAVGQRGTRVMAVINELGGEKIDIIEFSEAPEKFIANALSPAKVIEVKILPKNKALCVVPEDQLSLAIGKDGQNVRLAAKLTGWKIDVRAPEKAGETENEATEEVAEVTTEEKVASGEKAPAGKEKKSNGEEKSIKPKTKKAKKEKK